MAYSTIKNKKCKCGCGKNKSMGYAGYYYKCAPEKIKAEVEAKTREQRRKQRKSLQSKVRSLAPVDENEIKEKEQDLWYLLQMHSNEKVCDNCGLSLAHYNDWAWRSSQNHIVDKSPTNGCPSVATHPLNCNVLGMWCCHGQWGTNFENQSKMACFPAAKEKFQLFKQDIAPGELKKVNPYLLEQLPLLNPNEQILKS